MDGAVAQDDAGAAGDAAGPGQAVVSQIAGLPGLALAGIAAALLLLALAVCERAGLPGAAAWMASVAVVGLAIAAAVGASRNADEPLFLGRITVLPPVSAGLILGVLAASACLGVLQPASGRDLIATGTGAATGLLISGMIARLRAGSRLLAGEGGGESEGAPSLIQGCLIAAAGFLLAAAALPPAVAAIMALFGWSAPVATIAAVAAPAAALAAGGWRGLMALAAALVLMLAAGLGLSLWLGATQLGAFPLPGLSQPETLLAITSARAGLLPSGGAPLILAWLPQNGVAGVVLSLPFVTSAAIAALVARAASPGISLDRPATAGAASAVACLLVLALAAAAAYAVEAAGLQFVGASLQTPPPGLLAASQQGLAEFCGVRSQTLDELRAACGLAPRAQGVLPLERIRLTEAFPWGGVPVALGLPAALAAPARLAYAVLPAMGLIAGLWLMALGLGRGVLGRGRIAPGLASHRLALVRLAAVLSAAALAAMPAPASVLSVGALLAGLAVGLDLIQQGIGAPAAPGAGRRSVQRAAAARRSPTPRSTAQSA